MTYYNNNNSYSPVNKKFFDFNDIIYFGFNHLLYIFDYNDKIKYITTKDNEKLVRDIYGYDYYFINDYIVIL